MFDLLLTLIRRDPCSYRQMEFYISINLKLFLKIITDFNTFIKFENVEILKKFSNFEKLQILKNLAVEKNLAA